MLLKTSRRSVVRALAGASFASTTLGFFLRTAQGQTYPQRFLFVFTNAGRDSESRSTGTGASYALGAGYAPLVPLKAKVSVLDAMKLPPHTGEEHPCGKASLLTGRKALDKTWKASGPSFDRYLASKLTAGASFFTGTYNGKGSGDVGVNPVSWNGSNSANDGFVQGSAALIGKLFTGGGGVTTPAPAPGVTSAADANERALYDYLLADVKRLQGVASQSDVEKLELHVQTLMQLRGKHEASGTAAPPAMVTRSCGTVDVASAANETDKISSVIAQAFACDRARIGVVRFGSEDPYHDYSHWHDGASNRANMRAMDVQYARNFAHLLGQLDSYQEGDRTVLDNTVVVWSHDCCGEYGVDMDSGPPLPGEDNGANGIHNTGYVPFIVAGSLGGKLKAGQRFVLTGRSNVDLYRTIASAMGVDASDFGDPAFSHGPIKEILT
jgi:hypothetical protein